MTFTFTGTSSSSDHRMSVQLVYVSHFFCERIEPSYKYSIFEKHAVDICQKLSWAVPNFVRGTQTIATAQSLVQLRSVIPLSKLRRTDGHCMTAAWHGVAWRGMCILTDLLAWEGIASDCWAVICNGLWESVQFHMKSRSATIRDSEWANFYYLLVVNDLIVTRSDKWESDSWRSPDFRLSLTSHLWALWREWPQNAFASWIVLQHCWTKPRNTLKLCRAALLGTGPGSDASRPTCSTSGQRRWQMTLWHLNNSNTLDMKPFDAFWPLLTPIDAFQISTVCKIGQAALQTIFTMIDLHI